MADVHDPAARRRNMSAIKGKNTRPELLIRKALHARGFRYRLHGGDLPGKPDIVFPKFRAVIFVHGCFWHGHACPTFRWPATREAFWREKIGRNRERDAKALSELKQAGWRTGIIWECALKGRRRLPLPVIVDAVAAWFPTSADDLVIEGQGIV